MRVARGGGGLPIEHVMNKKKKKLFVTLEALVKNV
jgi:hypothetical protein